ncbi:DAR GTPase 2, mitochondrial-like [Zea mays]|uniref:DAR GTPase 2, mitochondrial-like n=1 Tax=Zea mays TaxID=4577 RepID=UPI0009AAC19B|nr:DAR GTPase 2, mitochondrial-like [Zea mays]|eukprot:XP_020401028.1 DAR GTPase 2, mitochondrial-like [Zea mays]
MLTRNLDRLQFLLHTMLTCCPCVVVNSHSRESIKEVLKVVQARMREIKHGDSNCTGTALLVGIPNVGKSAIVSAMHQIGRIAAAEKGKLKHAIVSSHLGETRDIRLLFPIVLVGLAAWKITVDYPITAA